MPPKQAYFDPAGILYSQERNGYIAIAYVIGRAYVTRTSRIGKTFNYTLQPEYCSSGR